MEAQLKAFLEKRKVKRDEPFSHTTKSTRDEGTWYSASYYIGSESQEKFWTLYCNAVRKKKLLTLTERPGPFTPLRVDFDFKTSLETGTKRQYTPEILKKIVGLYQEELRKIIDPEVFEDKHLWCLVLEKPAPRVENAEVKDGFHLHFPFFICEAWVQDNHLRDAVTKRMIEERIWKDFRGSTKVEDFIDREIAKKPWMMYGSVNYKSKKSVPYLYNRWKKVDTAEKYGHAFDHNLKEISLPKVFSDELIGKNRSVQYYLPRFLSIRGYTQNVALTISQKKSRSTIREKIKQKKPLEKVIEELKYIKDAGFMDMISDDRAEDYTEWMDVGWTLFNIGQGCEEALELWIDFSRRSSKFVDGECEKHWEKMEMRNKTIASLMAMAKKDSPEEYKQWKEHNIRGLMFESLESPKTNEYDICKIVSKLYQGRFICANSKKDKWYYYENHRWREMDDSVSLKKTLLADLIPLFLNLSKEINDEIGNLEYSKGLADRGSREEEELKAEIEKKTTRKKRALKIVSELKTVSFIKKLVEMCKLEFHTPDFEEKRDENRNLIGCENGVIDFETGVFRDGRPDDYITMTTGICFQQFSPEDEEVKELDEYFLKVYPNENRRNYFLDFMASCLKGGNEDKTFLIATGPSDGAKTMTFTLLEYVFGSGKFGYFGKFPRELIVQSTSKNSSSSARPELARVRGKRIMGCQELAKHEKINIGFIKEATGNDSFYVRNLWGEGGEIRPQYTLVMQCNEPPSVPGHDEATWSRIRVLDHESKFVKPKLLKEYPVPDDIEDQLALKRFKADPTFRAKLPSLAPVLLWKLFERFKVLKVKGIQEPEEVLLSTENYQASNDVYLQFIQQRIEKEEDTEKAKKTSISLADVDSEFNEWYKINYPSYAKKAVGRNTVKQEIGKRLGVIRNPEEIYGFGAKSRFWGYRFIIEDLDEDDGIEIQDTEDIKHEEEYVSIQLETE